MKLILSGACGRMGHEVAKAAREQGWEIAFGVDRVCGEDMGFPVYPCFRDAGEVPEHAVVIDFSLPEALRDVLQFAEEHGFPCLLAATGYTEEHLSLIRSSARVIPLFRSSNLSLGVHVLKLLAAEAKRMLPGFDIEIVEKHHSRKKDAPSGTAMTLYEALRSGDSVPVYDRHLNGLRRKEEIGIQAVRGGTVAGEHEIGFYGEGETLLLTHSAQNRSIFAFGALRAAQFLGADGRKPGEYGMDDLIHL